jgi:hypothetical protein
MTSPGDYMDDMPDLQLIDSEIETLLTGSSLGTPETADLEAFVAAIAVHHSRPRDVAHMATALAATARSHGTRTRTASVRRLVVLAAAGAMVVSLAGIAAAADRSAPGDILYGLDEALERFGLGSGGVDERIAEFDRLMSMGDEERAFSHLTEVVESSDSEASAAAQHHLELAAAKINPEAAAAQEKVAALREFIEQNKGPGVGLDGQQFGQGVSEIAKSGGAPPETGSSEGENPGETSVGESPEDSPPGNSENAGPPDKAGPNQDKTPGPPDHGGPKEGNGRPDDPGNDKDK